MHFRQRGSVPTRLPRSVRVRSAMLTRTVAAVMARMMGMVGVALGGGLVRVCGVWCVV